MSLRSPKAKFSASITLDKYLKGYGQSSTLTDDDLSKLKSMVQNEINRLKVSAYVTYRENKKTYPEYEWVVVVNEKITPNQ